MMIALLVYQKNFSVSKRLFKATILRKILLGKKLHCDTQLLDLIERLHLEYIDFILNEQYY